jgi:hypothetical protein
MSVQVEMFARAQQAIQNKIQIRTFLQLEAAEKTLSSSM